MSAWLLPNGWDWKCIEEVAAKIPNAVVDGPFGSNLKVSDYTDLGVPVLQGKNITGDTFSWFDVRFISDKKALELSRSSVREGDFLLVKIGSIGYSALVDDLKGYDHAIIPANLAKITIDKKVIDPDYFRNWLRSDFAKNYLINSASKTAQPALSLSKIKQLSIPVPPLDEQRRIAAILDQADALRRARRRAIERLNDLGQAIFYEMFGRKLGKNWKAGTLCDVLEVRSSLVDPKEEQYTNFIHVGPEHIGSGSGEIEYEKVRTVKEDGVISGKYEFDDCCVLYSKIRPYLNKVALPNRYGLCSADMYALEPIKGVSTKEFIKYTLMSQEFLSYTDSCSGRANIPKINREQLLAYHLDIPLHEEQMLFTKRISQVYRHKSCLRKHQFYLESLFSSLQHRAFRGEL